MRTFIAIEFPLHTLQQLEDAAHQLRVHLRAQGAPGCLRWAGLHNAHLTLRFLGETTEVQAQRLAAALADSARKESPFALSLGGVGGFPTLRQPRVLWLGVGGNAAQLNILQSAVEQCVQRAGFPAETRPYSPHVTLARASRRAIKSELRAIGQLVQEYAAEAAPSPQDFQVNEIVHMQSQLQRGGIHTPLGRFRLGAPPVG